MLTITLSEDQPTLVAMHGTIAGPDLYRFGEALDRAARAPALRVVVDLSDIDDWSLLAQAMILSTARRMVRRGGELILYGPTAALRSNSLPMDIFGRVPTRNGTMTGLNLDDHRVEVVGEPEVRHREDRFTVKLDAASNTVVKNKRSINGLTDP